MTTCPQCGNELAPEGGCPTCGKKPKKQFTIRAFLWDNFRLFTMVGITGTMISLIPNMGTRILGMSWITDSESYLPLFLSIIIFFGTIFLTICFLNIFSMVFEQRREEPVGKHYSFLSRTVLTWYEGDFQRFVLLLCLVPMWIGLMLFFILLMPQIPNRYSWLFSVIMMLMVVPLVIYAAIGLKVGRTVTGKVPGLAGHPRLALLLFTAIVVACLILIPYALPQYSGNPDSLPGEIRILADQQYFSPHISSAKGIRLEITNFSGREMIASRQLWSADYGYFLAVVPSTGDVTILGNPVEERGTRFVYWSFTGNGTAGAKKPVKIDLRLYPPGSDREIAHSSLYLTWYNDEIVQVNASDTSRQ